MPRTETPIKVAFWIFVSIYAIQMLLSVTYVFYNYGVLTDIYHFGWGKVPSANLQGYLWLSDNLPAITTFLNYTSVLVFAYLVYQTATLLVRLGVNKHLGAGMTTASLFIPFYNFYRPWAGLGEVANTLHETASRRSIPFIGIRGRNTGTVVLAFAIYAYALSEKILGVFVSDMDKRPSGTEAAAVSLLTDISLLLIIELIFTGVLLAIIVWYWTRIIRNYHDAISLPAFNIPEPETTAPTHDTLKVSTRPAL